MFENSLIDTALILLLGALLALRYFLSGKAYGYPVHRNEEINLSQQPSGYEKIVRQAGFNPSATAGAYWGMKLLFASLAPLLLIETAQGQETLLTLILAAAIGFFIPDFWLLLARKKRKKLILGRLSFFLDLVVALLKSGMPLDRALMRAAEDGFSEPHPLADEVLLVGREIELGKDRGSAFESLAARTGIPQLTAVASAVRMGLRQGSPVEDTLSAQADLIRLKRREQAMRQIQKSTVIALIPLLLCGLPLWAVIVYFPASLKISELFKALSLF